MAMEQKPVRGIQRVPQRERGFALLLVFALAASVAIMIYLEIPRVAFEHQRDKEALLIDRGEQYARALELYARKMNKRPQNLDELEHAQTIRFLRRRYKDPMTGKDEWRLVHVNISGQYVDSKIHKATGALEKEDSGPSILASKIQGVGQTATLLPQDGQAVSAALQKHASDRISPGGTAGAGDPGQTGAADPNADPNRDPSQAPSYPVQPGQAPGAPPGGPANAARFPFPGQPPIPGQQPTDAQQQGTQNGTNPAFGAVQPPAQQDGSGNLVNPGASNQTQAVQAIQSLIGGQRPAPAGAGGAGGANGNAGGQGGIGAPSALGAGLVGVATTVEMEGIRRYNDHSNYSEWEFLFDNKKDTKGQQGQGAGTQQQGASGNVNSGNSSSGSSFGGMQGGTPAPPSADPKN
jgi:hypothetical protein